MTQEPKIPCIALVTKIVNDNYDPLTTKFDCIPYIDKNMKYPTHDKIPMICVAQLNMDHIFSLLKTKNINADINSYFKQYPQTGLLQFYTPYVESLIGDDTIQIKYIKKYDISQHDSQKANSLEEIYIKYREKHGDKCYVPYEITKDNPHYYVYVTDAVYAYDFVNSTMQNHEYWNDELEDKGLDYLDNYENNDNTINIGGFPYHLQDDPLYFDENKECILLSIINSILGFNISIKKRDLKKLNFKCLVDLAY